MIDGRAGAVLVVMGGAAASFGSFMEWGTCPKDPCEGYGGLLHLLPIYGLGFGPGVVTALLGAFLVVAGLEAFRYGGESPRRGAAFAAATGILAAMVIWVIRMYAFPLYDLYGPQADLFFVLPGGLLAVVGSRAIREPASGRVDALRPQP